eukprot:scpid103055/ scgid1121/ 
MYSHMCMYTCMRAHTHTLHGNAVACTHTQCPVLGVVNAPTTCPRCQRSSTLQCCLSCVWVELLTSENGFQGLLGISFVCECRATILPGFFLIHCTACCTYGCETGNFVTALEAIVSSHSVLCAVWFLPVRSKVGGEAA